MIRPRFFHWLVIAPIFITALSSWSVSAKVLDNGVDPENLGTGAWIYYMSAATNKLGGNAESVTNVTSLMKFFRSSGVKFISVKAGTGGKQFPSEEEPQLTAQLVKECHAAKIKIFGYTRSDGKDVPGEIDLAKKVHALGADGFIIDAEAEWESHQDHIQTRGPELAIQLCEGIKNEFPNWFLGHSPFPIISKHSSFPYREFGYYCDAVMPQAYWKSIGVSPSRMVHWMDEEWHAFHRSLSGKWTNAIKPIAPIGQGWSPSDDKVMAAHAINEFVAALNHDKNPAGPGGYHGVSYWRADLHTAKMWRSIDKAKIGDLESTPASLVQADPVKVEKAERKSGGGAFENPNDFVMDDSSLSATFSGAWYEGKQKSGQFGESYRCANTVHNEPTAVAEFRPVIRNTGYYDVFIWHRHNANYSKETPWVITYKGESFTNHVDQTIEGGNWRLLADSLHLNSGTNVVVSINNATTDETPRVVVVDALRFVRKEELKPEGE